MKLSSSKIALDSGRSRPDSRRPENSGRVALIPGALKKSGGFPQLQVLDQSEQGRPDSRRPEKIRKSRFPIFLLKNEQD